MWPFVFNMKLYKVYFLQRSYDWGPCEQFCFVAVICFILFKDQSINLLWLPVLTCMVITSPIKPNSFMLCVNQCTKELKDISAAVLTSLRKPPKQSEFFFLISFPLIIQGVVVELQSQKPIVNEICSLSALLEDHASIKHCLGIPALRDCKGGYDR